jgi:hypothetical protein
VREKRHGWKLDVTHIQTYAFVDTILTQQTWWEDISKPTDQHDATGPAMATAG